MSLLVSLLPLIGVCCSNTFGIDYFEAEKERDTNYMKILIHTSGFLVLVFLIFAYFCMMKKLRQSNILNMSNEKQRLQKNKCLVRQFIAISFLFIIFWIMLFVSDVLVDNIVFTAIVKIFYVLNLSSVPFVLRRTNSALREELKLFLIRINGNAVRNMIFRESNIQRNMIQMHDNFLHRKPKIFTSAKSYALPNQPLNS